MLRSALVRSPKRFLGTSKFIGIDVGYSSRLSTISPRQEHLSVGTCANFSTKVRNSPGTNSASTENNTSCPFQHARGSTSAATIIDTNDSTKVNDTIPPSSTPELVHIPSWPVIGSFFSILPVIGPRLQSYYNIPLMKTDNAYEFYAQCRNQYGDFYSLTIPGMGAMHVLNDPLEMHKVLRQEGSYPRGGIQHLKPFVKWGKSRDLSLLKSREGEIGNAEDDRNDGDGFFGRGETWKAIRTFLQKDLLSPQAAKGYVPGIIKAAEMASKGAPAYSTDINTYLNYCAFDLFQSVMFGEYTKISDPNLPTDPINEKFVRNSVNSLMLLILQIHDKTEAIKAAVGIRTDVYNEFEQAMDVVNEIATEKVKYFYERWERNELSEEEANSYFAHAFQRQKEKGSVSTEEMVELAMFLLNAGVDTTSTFIAWALVHLSLNPHVQETLYKELKSNLEQKKDGRITVDMLNRENSPYLHAVLRESHRMTPAHPTTMSKSNSSQEIEIHGVTFPKGSLFTFDSFSVGVDPNYVPKPKVFDPDRWTKEAVQGRKGTIGEVLDHPFYKDPFSQGARKCPGSRVAVNETLVFLSQLVLDWKFEFDSEVGVESLEDIKYEQKTLLVPNIPKMSFTSR